MKDNLSKDRLNYLHEALDRELENVEAQQFPISSLLNRSKEKTKIPMANSELEQLQKKLNYLEKKMENIRLDEEGSSQSVISDTEVAPYRPAAEPKFTKYPRDMPLATFQGKSPKRYPKSSHKKTFSKDRIEAAEEETPLKRKYDMKEERPSSSAAASKSHKKAITRKQLESMESDLKKAYDNLNISRKSISQHSVQSVDRRNKSLHGSISRSKQPEHSRVERLEKYNTKLKNENKKLKTRVRVLYMIYAEYVKLKENFDKSEQIRKQQKTLLYSYKNKLQKKS